MTDQRRKPHSPEHRARISAALKGRPLSPEHRAKVSATMRGRKLTEEHRQNIVASLIGNKRPAKGDDIGYMGAHHRARAALSGPCSFCGKTDGIFDAALRHDGSPSARRVEIFRGRLRSFSLSVADYMRLCRRCHNAYDDPKSAPRRALAA